MSKTSPRPTHHDQHVHEVDVGVLLTDTTWAQRTRDAAKSRNFGFPSPVLYERVAGTNAVQLVERKAEGLLDRYVEAAHSLVDRGIRGLTTSCGFLSIFQRELADRVDAVVATSALLQVPFILQMMPVEAHVGIITANGSTLGPDHLSGAGINDNDKDRLSIIGLEHTEHFYPVIVKSTVDELDTPRIVREVVTAATAAVKRDHAIRAFLLECTALPPYASAIHSATGLPVWDFGTLASWLQAGFRRT